MNAAPVLNQEWLTSLDMRVLAVQRIDAHAWWNYRQVSSPFSRLWLVLGGEGSVRHHGRRYTLTSGKFHLVPPFALHDCRCPRRLDHYHLHFVARHRTGIDLFSLLDFDFEVEPPPGTLALFERLEGIYPGRKLPCFDPAEPRYKEFSLASELSPQHLSSVEVLESRALLALLLAPFLKTARPRDNAHALATERFLAVQELIQQKMRERITLKDLASAAGLHPTYFSDRFKQLVGVRPMDYLLRRRIEVAQFLLMTTQAPVKEVAFEVGIPDPAYFARVFGKMCGCSPHTYKQSGSRP